MAYELIVGYDPPEYGPGPWNVDATHAGNWCCFCIVLGGLTFVVVWLLTGDRKKADRVAARVLVTALVVATALGCLLTVSDPILRGIGCYKYPFP